MVLDCVGSVDSGVLTSRTLAAKSCSNRDLQNLRANIAESGKFRESCISSLHSISTICLGFAAILTSIAVTSSHQMLSHIDGSREYFREPEDKLSDRYSAEKYSWNL